MAKFLCVESRVFPTLAMTLDAGAVVDLADDVDVAGLVRQSDSKKAAPVVETPVAVVEAAPADGKVSE